MTQQAPLIDDTESNTHPEVLERRSADLRAGFREPPEGLQPLYLLRAAGSDEMASRGREGEDIQASTANTLGLLISYCFWDDFECASVECWCAWSDCSCAFFECSMADL
jgi:hypothetical protein